MRSSPTAADQRFLEEVRAFIAAHWRSPFLPDAGRGDVLERSRRAWTEALVARGWSVPEWPIEHGGTGWPAYRGVLWRRELALAGVPGLDEAGIEWVGPALWNWGDRGQQARFLPAIRNAQECWCLGLLEPISGAELPATATTARRSADGYRVDGGKVWVAGGERARWMLTLARTGAAGADRDEALSLLIVDLLAAGVDVQPVAVLGAAGVVCSVALSDVQVPFDRRIGAEGSGLAAVMALRRRVERQFAPAGGLRRLADALVAAVAELPGDEGPLAEDSAFARKVAEFGVDLAGLEAQEWRYVWALQDDSERSVAAQHDVIAQVLGVRHARLAERLGELFVEAFGYYSLPYPDPLGIDNEGPIGHHYALAAIRGMLAGRALPADAGAGEGLRDRIANQLFGY